MQLVTKLTQAGNITRGKSRSVTAPERARMQKKHAHSRFEEKPRCARHRWGMPLLRSKIPPRSQDTKYADSPKRKAETKKSSEQALLEGLHAYMVGDEGFEPPTLTL